MHGRFIGSIAIAVMLVFPIQGLARGPWRADEGNTRGWQLMTPQERIEHQSRVRSFASYPECLEYQREHHRLMEARARQQGKVLRAGGRDFCEHLKVRDTSP